MSRSADTAGIRCEDCGVSFTQKKNLYAHARKFHPNKNIDFTKNYQNICVVCEEKFSSFSLMLNHMGKAHTDLKLTFGTKTFYSDDDFEKWKQQIEEETVSHFILRRSKKELVDGRIVTHYRCSRSGLFKPEGSNIRRMKIVGSKKIGKACPAYISVYKTIINDVTEIEVEYQSEHVGHKQEVGRLPLTSEEKDTIARYMEQGVPNSTILKIMQSHFSPTKRASLITTKDLHNISRDRKLNMVLGDIDHKEEKQAITKQVKKYAQEQNMDEEKAELNAEFQEILRSCQNIKQLRILKEVISMGKAKLFHVNEANCTFPEVPTEFLRRPATTNIEPQRTFQSVKAAKKRKLNE